MKTPECGPAQSDVVHAEVLDCLRVLPILREQLGEATGQADRAVVQVCETFQSIAECVREIDTDESSGRLQQELQRIVVLMQFQDAVSQRIRHVADALEQMETMLKATLGLSETEPVPSSPRIPDVFVRYVVETQRDIAAREATCRGDSENELF